MVLAMLRQAEGWCSGEEVSRRLGVSRAAVAKHVRVLRTQGYDIQAVTRRGYRLGATDILDANELQQGLGTTCFGKVGVHWHARTDSTNRDAVALAVGGAAEGTVVLAGEQQGGRARTGRVWDSPPGGLYLSLVLRPRLAPQAAPLVTLLTAVAVCEAISLVTGLAPVVKWPNDVLMGARKVSGNLTEVGLVADTVDWVVTGVGINVNTRADQFDSAVRERATSLVLETGGVVPRVELARAFLQRAEHWYAALRDGDPGPVITRWKELSSVVGKTLRVRAATGVIEGRVLDMTPEGLLRLCDADGHEYALHAGDVIDSRA